ncbi:Hydroxymethylglutaryl-CoA lyase, mitochondrial [Toxocara canis]|uniref:hydroxymethylglutaryl-CoA lyase n=1 Tax=Toxocara canis TaxID=6265 RepID=A0A0B2V2C7_TOXCA|nr:Hydroxymethylglutaryl-CoA lyase, mitochondrial [Toxocara canis]
MRQLNICMFHMRTLPIPASFWSRSRLQHALKKQSSLSARTSFKIVEVGPRDGLQNERQVVATENKISLIERLADCGLKCVEATSFVSPKWVPQMADHNEVISRVKKLKGVSYPVLVPNMAGLNNVISNGSVKEIAVFTAASESFSKKNTNCSMEESMRRLRGVIEAATASQLLVRGYVSCVIGCPYDGAISPTVVTEISESLLDAGCYEVSLGDTIGVGSAGSVRRLLRSVLASNPVEHIAVHFHDTYGQALSNVLVAFDLGIRVADSSVAGLGGCPYADGATGNLATEDLVYMLDDLGVHTGVDLMRVVEVGDWICGEMGRVNSSRVARAIMAKKGRSS